MSAKIIDFPKGGSFPGGLRVRVNEQLLEVLAAVIEEAAVANGGQLPTAEQFEELVMRFKK